MAADAHLTLQVVSWVVEGVRQNGKGRHYPRSDADEVPRAVLPLQQPGRQARRMLEKRVEAGPRDCRYFLGKMPRGQKNCSRAGQVLVYLPHILTAASDACP